jgi:hypothetical protein
MESSKYSFVLEIKSLGRVWVSRARVGVRDGMGRESSKNRHV